MTSAWERTPSLEPACWANSATISVERALEQPVAVRPTPTRQRAVFVSETVMRMEKKLKRNLSLKLVTQSCGTTTNTNNTYFVNSGYPATYSGGSRCNIVVTRSGTDVCQLKVSFIDFSLAQVRNLLNFC